MTHNGQQAVHQADGAITVANVATFALAGERLDVHNSFMFGAAAGEMKVTDSAIIAAAIGHLEGENVTVFLGSPGSLALGILVGVLLALAGSWRRRRRS